MKKLGYFIAAVLVTAQFAPLAASAEGRGVRGGHGGASRAGHVSRSSGGHGRTGGFHINAGNGPGRHNVSIGDFAASATRNSNDPRWRGNRHSGGGHDRDFDRWRGRDHGRYDWRDLLDYYGLDRDYSRNDLYDYLYGRDDHISDAYRDAAIANAIANVFGLIATAAIQPQPVAIPAGPVISTPVGPVYETQRVLVREGYEATEQVWVPEYYDALTQTTVEGHYETHTRWVPPVYETRQVRVR